MKKILLVCMAASLAFASCVTQKNPAPISVKDLPPVSLGSISANNVTRLHGTLKPQEVLFTSDPAVDIVRMYHKLLGDKIWIFLNRESRATMITAMETYLAQYKAGELTTENDKKKAFFGQTKTDMAWGVSSGGHQAEPTLRFEYQLINNRPYFILASTTVDSITTANDQTVYNAPALRLAFSPAHCNQVLKLINQETLDALTEERLAEYQAFDIVEPFDETSETSDGF